MPQTRVKFSNIVQNQLPAYIRDDFPLVAEFFKAYYLGQEYQGGPIDLIENIDKYTKVGELTNLTNSVILDDDLELGAQTINVDLIKSPTGTQGFPDTWGLLQIGDEIITYTEKTDTSFTGCVRGFSGVTSYDKDATTDSLVFNTSSQGSHDSGSTIKNLSVLFLQQFLLKTKHQLTPGLEDRTLHDDLNQNIFIKQAKDFYLSKGTDRSFEILFKALYAEDVSVVRPREFLVTPSNANYRITNDLVVEPIEGNPEDLQESTLFQAAYADSLNKAYAPITSVEPIEVGYAQTYYKLSIDAGYNRDIRVDGSVYGAFNVQPSTRVIGQVATGSTVLTVDSTVGFADTGGDLYVNYSDETVGVVSYTSKSLTQFFGVGVGDTGVVGTINNAATIGINTFAYGQSFSDQTKTVKVRINSVLSKFTPSNKTFYYSKNDTAKIKTLGVSDTGFKAKNWFYNISPIYKVKSVELIDASDKTYQVTVNVNQYFQLGDSATLILSDDSEKTTTVVNIISSKTILIRGQGNLDTTDTYTIRRNISKAQSNTFPQSSLYSTNVQNVYASGTNLLVASPSLPSYNSQPLNVYSQDVKFTGTFVGTEFEIKPVGDHGFYTGDAVYYTPEYVEYEYFDSVGTKETGVKVNSSLFAGDVGYIVTGLVGSEKVTDRTPPNEGLYFIQRVSQSTVKLAKSRNLIYNSTFISLDNNTIVTNCSLQTYGFRFKTLESQQLLRKVSLPENDGTIHETEPGFTGLLVNGVQIANYKSRDIISYGKIKDIEVVTPGSDYDIINPPILNISDAVGTGATGYVAVSGNLKEIRILDSGFDYQETPVVNITGGNGKGATASANMKQIVHSISFNSQSDIGIGTTFYNSYEIGFSTYHKFSAAEEVIYTNEGQTNIGGITTDSSYFVSLVGLTTVKLYNTQPDAIVGINTVELTSFGVGTQSLRSYNKKSVVESINVTDSGSGYENKKRTVLSTGISTSYNYITLTNHDYQSGDVINYVETTGTAIGGLSVETEYYVTTLDTNKFKLSAVGVGTTTKDFYYETKQYLDFTTSGVGTHTFNYPDISVSVVGTVGIASTGTETFECEVQPIFRGTITSTHLSNNGAGYGSSEIVNFVREPEIVLISGENAQLEPVINNGTITEVIVMNQGQKYNSAPILEIVGDGIGAVITPVFENNAITAVKVIHGGTGYTIPETSISVKFPGSGVKFRPHVDTWRVNLFEKNIDNFTGDDGYIPHEYNDGYGLQYSNLYAPRKLRESVYGTNQEGDTLYGSKDLIRINSLEVPSTEHSPIIGWAYDGNPIYGPYGYTTKSGGIVTQMKTGYSLSLKSGRPPVSLFPAGFFVEDYTYKEVSDETILDENNGRFCITPQFPEGTYAYFATINDGAVDGSGPFVGYKRPTFPYLIGDNYRSIPNDFNLAHDSNQSSIDLSGSEWKRNTAPYNLIEGETEYEYVYIPNKLSQTVDVKAVTPGVIESIGIQTGGDLYQIGDPAVFDNAGTEGTGVVAKVSTIHGKSVSNISVATSSVTGFEIYGGESYGRYTLIADNPHNFKNKDTVVVTGLSTTSSQIDGIYSAGITTNRFVVTGVGTDGGGIGTDGVTGLVTYFNVIGDLTYPSIAANDILGIGTERVRVLNPQPNLSRIRVLRAVDGTVAVAHTVTSFLFQDQRKLTINAGFNTTLGYKRNTQIYFNPSETAGIGTTAGVGIVSTISIENVGSGITQISIPTKTLYIPGHNLDTGDELTYSPNNGAGLVVLEEGASYPSGVSTLSDGQTLYAAKINGNLLGISTVRVGLGTTGVFVGIASTCQDSRTLFFTGVGTGVYHSFKTNYTPLTAKVERHLVTVAAASSHGLTNNDEVTVNVNPGVTTSFVIKYNDYNRKLVVTPKSFAAAGVNTSTNAFTLTDHGFVTGQKVIYTAESPIEGLTNDGIYFVVKIDGDTFKLSTTHYDATLEKPIIVGITSTSIGTISPINPSLKVYKDSTVSFDVSDSSLSYTNQSTQYAAFELNFYDDKNFTNIWDKSLADKDFNVVRTGTPGVTAGAKVDLTVNGNIPEVLYYRLDPLFESDIPEVKQEVNVDKDIVSNNQILTEASLYNGKQTITTASTTAFTYTVDKAPENVSYAGTVADVQYETTSTSAYGPISKFEIKNEGRNYYSIPGITTVTSSVGGGVVAEPSSTSIGQIKRTKIEDIGYTFPSDSTLEPSALLPQIIDIESLASFKSIGITSAGRGYGVAPKLLVRDGKTKKIITDADLRYSLGDNNVKILKNPTGMTKSYAPTLIPYENSNGVGISTVGFNTITKDVFAKLSVGFSTADVFPFVVGDKVMIENVFIGIGSTGKGYNSADHDYTLFTVNAVDANLGGIGATITYSMSDQFPDSGTFPGTFDPNNSSGRIIPEKYFPTFDISLGVNDYLGGETVTSNSASGEVESWSPEIGILKVSSNSNFVVGETIKGLTSNTQGIASSIRSFDSELTLGSSSRVENGWETDSGVLNYNMQRLQDSFYYQNFSYALRSRVVEEKWDDVVSTTNHTLGFKKFSDYQLETTAAGVVGLTTNQTSLDIVTDMIGYGDLNCVYDFDLVTENSLNTGSTFYSDEIIFSNRILMDYKESVGNRVLSIDDMSGTFNSNPRATVYSVVDTFKLSDVRAQKYFAYIIDKRYTQERQLMVITLLHDGAYGYMNQYGRLETVYDQGSFDFQITGSEGKLLFYPTKATVNDYDITTLTYNLNDNYLGIGSTALGGIADINTSSVEVPTGTTTTIVGIASTYRSVKVLVEITPDNTKTDEYEFNEFNLIHDGSTVDLIEYGELTTTQNTYSTAGYGTFYPYISGKDLKVDFVPNSGIGTTCVVNTIQVAISSESSSGISTIDMNHAQIVARATSISSSGTPGITTIGQYANDYDAGYFIVQVSDTTNNFYQMSEVLVVDNYISDPSETVDTYNTEYGNVVVNNASGLGTIGSLIDSDTGVVSLVFTPNASINVEVKTYMNAIKNVVAAKDEIDFTNAHIDGANSEYYGTERDIKRAFNLTHDNYNIFERYFLGNDATIVSVADNTITIPNHFWVTGETITYSHVGTAASGVGIASTDGFAGVGTTTFLPDSLYVVKVNADTIKIATTAEKALSVVPETVDITSVGIGTSHLFVSTNQNAKALMCLDNIIQSPVVSTAVTTTLAHIVYNTDNLIKFSGITSFFGADLIKINNEIMKIEGVGIGSTNMIRVRREWLGTTLAGHSTGDVITKVIGNYNIVNNLLTFAEAPYGNVPLSSTTNPPDERDWVGIATGSHFQGRTFMRSGETDSSNESYSENYVFDSISSKFDGIENTFALESGGSAVTGIQTDTVILLNDVFQGNGSAYDYTISQVSSASSIVFTGTATSITSDPNGSNLPLGGIIVSVGSSEGLGYQPLVSAGGTAVVGTSGTVSSISVGYTGSGYRVGVQTVNISIQQESLTGTDIVAIGTATVKDGHVTGTAVTNPHVFYAPKTIANVGYTHSTGIATVTTATAHGLALGNEINLSGIAFTCDYSPRLAISTAAYNSVTGVMTVTTVGANGYNTSGKTSQVIFTGLAFTCGIDGGTSTHYYPRGQDLAYNTSVAIAGTASTTITVDVGYAGGHDQFSHTFVGVGTSAVIVGGDYAHQFVSAATSAVISGGDYEHTFVSVGVGTITITGIGSTVVTDASYTPSTGDLVLTVGSGHTYTTDNTVGIATSALIFTCAMDNDATNKTYPRSTDPIIALGTTAITATTSTTFTVNVGASPLVYFDVSDATYDANSGIATLTIGSHSLTTSTSIRLSDNSLTFRCAMDDYATLHTYPRSTDPGFSTALGITTTTANTISINVGVSTIVKYDVSAADYNATTGIMTMTIGDHTLKSGTNIKIATESLTFTCSKDGNSTTHRYPRKPDPYYGGTPITAVNSTTEFEVNIGVSTVPTFYVGLGSVQAAILAPRANNNSASKTDPAANSATVLDVIDEKSFLTNVGISTLQHYYARGGTLEKPLDVIFDDPLSYSNLALEYSANSTGIGTAATIDVVVGQGSSIVSFTVQETGYGFGQGETLTVPIGGTTGIPTTSSYREMLIEIDETFSDEFTGWSVGLLQMLDNWDSDFDGSTTTFQLSENDGDMISIRSRKGSEINVQDVLLIFINDILQVPGKAYTFNGGSVVTFTEAPKKDDTSKILFYKGSGASDVVDREIIETVKKGDDLTIERFASQPSHLYEDERIVLNVDSTDIVSTNPYYGPGNTADESLERPVVWCRQTEDKIINELPVGKDRELYEPQIAPFGYITKTVGIGSTTIYVDQLRPLFNTYNERVDKDTLSFQNKVNFLNQSVKTGAAGTAIISGLGTISSVLISDGGVGYTTATVSFASTVGVGTTSQAYGNVTIGSAGTVTGIAITAPGVGYTFTESWQQQIVISPPTFVSESNSVSSYSGDQGVIVGFGTTTISSNDQMIFDFYIPQDSFLRDDSIAGTAVTISGISTNDIFVVRGSNVGDATTSITSVDGDSNTVGVGTSFIDNVYSVNTYEIVNVPSGVDSSGVGIGTTYCARIFAIIDSDFSWGGSGIETSNYYGTFSWGRIDLTSRAGLNSYTAYTEGGVGGITTSTIIERNASLKYKGYDET
tara:strand:+ start:3602 stop:17350 length:13749 start_codon:yes stop_codon:yes gene_type:complete